MERNNLLAMRVTLVNINLGVLVFAFLSSIGMSDIIWVALMLLLAIIWVSFSA